MMRSGILGRMCSSSKMSMKKVGILKVQDTDDERQQTENPGAQHNDKDGERRIIVLETE